jgi:hypothetical protein
MTGIIGIITVHFHQKIKAADNTIAFFHDTAVCLTILRPEVSINSR